MHCMCTDLMFRVDDELAGGVPQWARLLVEGLAQALQGQNAQCVLGNSYKALWTLLRSKTCTQSCNTSSDVVHVWCHLLPAMA